MTREEFESLTGIRPTWSMYRVIEENQIKSGLDATEFCRRYSLNVAGLAETIQRQADVMECQAEQRRLDRITELVGRQMRTKTPARANPGKGVNGMHKKYCLYDFYECYGIVAECETLREVRKAWTSWVADTDGECDLMILLWDQNLQGFRPFHGSEK